MSAWAGMVPAHAASPVPGGGGWGGQRGQTRARPLRVPLPLPLQRQLSLENLVSGHSLSMRELHSQHLPEQLTVKTNN